MFSIQKLQRCSWFLLFLFYSSISSAYTIPVPTESNEQLRTPGVGFQESIGTMPSDQELANCNFNDNHQNFENAGIKAGSKYIRMLWQEFEPTDNDFQFDKLDRILECSHQEGKAVDIRIMLTYPDSGIMMGGILQQGLPEWLKNKGGSDCTTGT